MRAGAALLVLAAAIAGCALPTQQLSLPGPITGSVAAKGATSSRFGTPLSDPADAAARDPQIDLGSGRFTQQPVRADGAAPGVQQGVRTSGDGVSLNFSGVTIAELARAILGDALGLNYTVSDGLKGSVTIQTAMPIPRQDLLRVFEMLARQEGAALVVDGGVYRVVPSESARAGTFRERRPPAGLRNMIVPLRYVSADEMQRILSAIAPQSSIVRSDEARNLLIVSGTPTELESIRETVSVFDVDWMRGMSFAILPVESADPEAIATELDTVFANDRSGPTKGLVRFVPNRRLKAVLVITSRPSYIATAQRWVKRLDLVGQQAEQQVHVYRVQNRPAGEMANLLRKIYVPQADQGGERRFALAPGQDATTISSDDGSNGRDLTGAGSVPPARNDAAEPRPIPPFTPFPVPAPAAPTLPSVAAGQAAPPALGPAQPQTPAAAGSGPDDRRSGVQVVADEANNSLIITATRSEFQRIRRVLAQLDVPPTQVLLEATIAEVTLNDQLRFGLRWFFQRGNSSASLTDVAVGAVASRFPGFSYFLNMTNLQVALNALADVTTVNIVSSPSLMTLDNKKAMLQIGDEVPVATQSAVSIVAPGAPVVNSIAFRSTGVILGITPRVSENGQVLLDIEQEVSDVTPTTTSQIDSPTIQQRRIKTQVVVGNGESIVLAGFMQDRATKGAQQVPVLGNIPVVGNLFKDKANDIRRTELLIAITPQIIKDPMQLRGIASEFRDRLNLTTRPQRQAPPDLREDIDRVLVR